MLMYAAAMSWRFPGILSAGGVMTRTFDGDVLPDTTTSNRYTLYDAPLLSKAFKDAGISAVIQNAHGTTMFCHWSRNLPVWSKT